MDYSNESFERFQTILRREMPEDSLLWQLRDSLFGEAYYGRRQRVDHLNRFPGGWLLSLAVQWFQARRASKGNAFPSPKSGQKHFLFLSSRNNHINRIYPMFREHSAQGDCRAWYTMEGVPDAIGPEDRPRIQRIVGEWSRHMRPADFFAAASLTQNLRKIFPKDLPRQKLAKICIYLVQFLAWHRFWERALGEAPSMVVATFEKAPHAKSFFHAAWQKACPSRIHWIHGLRHASIQATLATDLWCMTPGDVRFFVGRVPNYCTPSVKRNPEADELIRQVGLVNPTAFARLERLHFLFLGPGTEASYTRDMRMADLAVIRKLQEEMGNRIAWRFRPHPSCVERFRTELQEAGIRIDEFSTGHLHEDLKWAHAVGSSWSSLLLDIRETGRPIFWIQAEVRTLGAVDELIADGIGVHLDLDHGVERFIETVGHSGLTAP